MLAWLGEWLQSIVVVVLLAIVIELVLPSSKMLRYSRLVIGLVLLLTMMNPIFQLFQIDLQEKLNASFLQWEKETNSKQSIGTSLQKITDNAEKLQQQREGAALDVTRASLEQAILQQLLTTSTAHIANVSVQLGWSSERGKQQLPYIKSVTVQIAMQQAEAEKQHEETIEVIAPIEIEPITLSEIHVNQASSDEMQDEQDKASSKGGLHSSEAVRKQQDQFHIQAKEIIAIIAAGWNVNPDHIFVQASHY